MEKSSRLTFILVLILVFATAVAIALDTLAWRGHKSDNIRVFQKAVGGLGMGAIATPIWQFINYDTRIFSVDDSITWPVPGGYSYGPDRTGTVSYFEEFPEDQWNIREP
ncbi:MAG: hypothetical protein PVH82_06910 [Desulfobacteraceae bacterium]|jgi:hypothetical protein